MMHHARADTPRSSRPSRPLAFLDVDGPIRRDIRTDPDPEDMWRRVRVDMSGPHGRSVQVTYRRDDGTRLRSVDRIVTWTWATGWRERANDLICPLLELDPLPLVPLPDRPHHGPGNWKRGHITAYAGPRPFAWLDDRFDEDDERWAATRTDAGIPTLLLPCNRREGLTRVHIDHLRIWAMTLSAATPDRTRLTQLTG